MIYQNIEFFNVAQILHHEDGSISWRRVPEPVYDTLEARNGKAMTENSTGVELRFVLRGDKAVFRMAVTEDEGSFHVYRGGVQGGWEDHEVNKLADTQPREFVIKRSANLSQLKIMHEKNGLDWDCEVIRMIFDRGTFRIYDIQGDLEPPKPEQCPQRTLLCYGSSITHGSNSIDASHSWVSMLAYRLGMDARNLGMAGSCALEPAFAEYLAAEGEANRWYAAVLELGINVLSWEEPKIRERVTNLLRQVAGRNPKKPVFVISPFYFCKEEFSGNTDGQKWRQRIEEVITELAFPNVTYINGLDILDHMRYISADEIHPNIYGVQRIADRLTEIMKPTL